MTDLHYHPLCDCWAIIKAIVASARDEASFPSNLHSLRGVREGLFSFSLGRPSRSQMENRGQTSLHLPHPPIHFPGSRPWPTVGACWGPAKAALFSGMRLHFTEPLCTLHFQPWLSHQLCEELLNGGGNHGVVYRCRRADGEHFAAKAGCGQLRLPARECPGRF